MEELVTSARVVCRSRPYVAALPHVHELLASFLAPAGSWTIEHAIRCGCRRLARYLIEELAADPELHDLEKRVYVRRFVVQAAADEGDVALLELLAARFDFCVDSIAVNHAFGSGQLESLQWLVDRARSVLPEGDDENILARQVLSSDLASSAAFSGHTEALRWIDARIGGLDEDYARAALCAAASSGHIHIVEWLQPLVTIALPGYSVAGIASAGHADVIRFLHSKSMLPLTSEVMDKAAGHGSLDLLQWMLESGGDGFTSYAMEIAASSGNIEAMRWLRSRGIDCTAEATNAATRKGHVEALKFLIDHFPEQVTPSSFSSAVKYNHLSIVQYMLDHRGDVCVDAMGDNAACGGHLEMIKWLQTNSSHTAFTSAAMDTAASNGHLGVVRFLHENRTEGCTAKAMDGAASSGHLDVVQWLHDHRSEGCTTKAMDSAAENGYLHVVEWLHDHRSEGCTTAAMDGAAEWGHLEIVQFLHAHRIEGCTTHAMDRAGYFFMPPQRRLKILCWLGENRHEGFTREALDVAAKKGDVGALEWLDDRAHSSMWTPKVACRAAKYGNVEVLDWLAEHHPETFDAEALMRLKYLPWWVSSWLKCRVEV